MKRNPTPENRGRRTKGRRKRCVGRFAVSSANCSKAGQIGPTTFSHMNEVRITKAEILRTAEAIKRAGCRDVLIISTPEYVRFIVTMGSVALFAHGLCEARKYDSFGAGYYYNAISNDLKNSIKRLTFNTASANDEMGMEIF